MALGGYHRYGREGIQGCSSKHSGGTLGRFYNDLEVYVCIALDVNVVSAKLSDSVHGV